MPASQIGNEVGNEAVEWRPYNRLIRQLRPKEFAEPLEIT